MSAFSAHPRVGVRAAILRCWLLGCLASASGIAPGCTLGDTPPNCVPNRSVPCTNETGCSGHQTCSGDGYSYGPCTCDQAHTVPPIEIDAGDGGPPNLLGAPCITDADCAPLLFCVDAGSKKIVGEGPANGMCAADCAKDASACTRLDPASVCRTFDDNGTTTTTSDDVAYCVRGCTTGSPPGVAKCFGRPDMACVALGSAATKGVCIPVCRNDADCAPRFCDLGSGLCADATRAGAAIGATCSASNTNECAGFCNVDVATAYSECEGYCANGSVGCGQTGGPPYDAFCVTSQPSGGGWAGGDFGFCGKLCDCDKDCGRADAVCSPLPAVQAGALGRKGACRSATLGKGVRPGLPCAAN